MSATLATWNVLACCAIFAWATFCALHPKVRDGIVGKVIFSLAAMSALSVLLGTVHGQDTLQSEITLNVSVGLVGLRHIVMKTVWPKLANAVRCKVHNERPY
ncbi:hypothetical protein AB7813_08325 [Tardiphaga sp. 20_F10_N6_6]|uniref:hypothetical protein n=1 Tax=Tardiphaga sp. 20_F10_N6_6 TaxID=3240788 RepID=UPI003F8C2071